MQKIIATVDMIEKGYKIILLTGPTAAGKSDLAIEVAKIVNGVVINADAMQVYKEIPIITAVPLQKKNIEHMLYCCINGNEAFSIAIWLTMIRNAIDDCVKRNKVPIITGGSTMYVRLLIDGISSIPDIPSNVLTETRNLLDSVGHIKFHVLLSDIDPRSSSRIAPTDTYRMLRAYAVKKYTDKSIMTFYDEERIKILHEHEVPIKIALMPPRAQVYDNCHSRFIEIIDNGGVDEAIFLMHRNYFESSTIYKAIGYAELKAYALGKISREEAIMLAVTATRQYAKRQMTWIRNKFCDFNVFNNPDAALISTLI